MKNMLVGLAVVVIVAGAAYALVPRNVLKQFFQTGDKPTQAQFKDTIDSELNLQNDKNADTSAAKQIPYKPKEYEAGDTVIKADAIYQARVVTDEKKKEFTLDSMQSVKLKWTPIVLKSNDPVTYRVKVWQLMQGQTRAQAMKSNQPVATKVVTGETGVSINGLYTGPCKPPYLCEFVWSVEMVSDTSMNTGAGATSTPTPAPPPAKQEETTPSQTGGEAETATR